MDIQIEGAILVNFENVKPVIDALGGVDIEIDQNEYLAIRSILWAKIRTCRTAPVWCT